MVERLTKCIDSHLLDNDKEVKEYSLNSKIEFNEYSCMDIPNAVYDKLGILEDIMGKYHCNDVEELDKKLADSNTWKKACELMGKTIQNVYPDPFYRFTQDIPNYFYQQAKNLEANSEKTNCNTDN